MFTARSRACSAGVVQRTVPFLGWRGGIGRGPGVRGPGVRGGGVRGGDVGRGVARGAYWSRLAKEPANPPRGKGLRVLAGMTKIYPYVRH